MHMQLENTNCVLDVQELQHAVFAQQIASPHPYKKDYKEQIVGKGPHDPTIGYPEHDHHKKVGELISSVSIFESTVFCIRIKKKNINHIIFYLCMKSTFCSDCWLSFFPKQALAG